jgi:hypothetical protein
MSDRFAPGDRFIIGIAVCLFVYVLVLDLGTFWQGCNAIGRRPYSYDYAYNDRCTVDGIVSLIWLGGAIIDRLKDDLTAISTTIIAAFTVVLAWATHRQARLTQLVADTSKDAAEAAKNTADISYKILTRLEAPHLYPVNLSYVYSVDQFHNVSHVSVSAAFKNYGRSPAILKNASIQVAIFVQEKGEPSSSNADSLWWMG